DKRDKEGWIPGGIEPFLPSDSDIYDIVPPVIIEYMIRVDVNPTKIESRSAFQHPQLGSRKFNFRFAKFSPYHILGTIAEIKVENKETQPGTAERKSGLENVVAINDYIERKAQNADYDELKYYMKKYPEFEEHIFSEFYMRWKPLIDRKLLDLSMLP
ncbi:MAG: hypothetical protein GY950_15395, partial [bacterium]|nr:hypothetical protein [bacterium]